MRIKFGGGGDAYVVGARNRALLKETGGFARAVSVHLRPGWSTAILGVPAHELTDKFVRLEELWGAHGAQLETELVSCGTDAALVQHLERALTTRPINEPSSARLARRAVRLLEPGDLSIDTVAKHLGVTARHMRRAFAENIGIAPKQLARALRLQKAIHLARTTTNWTQVASAAGYYDQAHLITDFHALVGLTPTAFAERSVAAVR